MPSSVIIGRDETGRLIKSGDVERRGGVYVVGKPRTGKSHLLVSLAIQDIANNHGLLFIDPHVDAINAILERIPAKRMDDLILLDPTHETHAFSINPLFCANPHDLRERQLCFGQAWDVFAKAFGQADERLGILLGKYLGNCLYPLIEIQGYSLYDLWDFLLHRPFRESLLARVRCSQPEVIDFWHDAFDKMSPRDQRVETESLLNRLEALRRNPYIKHIISQPVPTIDFAQVLQERKLVLLRMPPWQDIESKAFIGTLVLSQLLKVIFLRTEISEHLRTPFSIMVDEFQDVATPDLAKLFTRTGKFHIMPHVAHQERLGQLNRDDPNRGATLAAPIKVFFSLAVHDSAELAPEVAKDSPTETKRERILIVSQQPVADILKGHANSEVQACVTEYLRSLSHRLEDTKASLEALRIKRLLYLDRAGIERLWAQYLKEHPYYNTFYHDSILGLLQQAAGTMGQAANQTLTMLEVHEAIQSLVKVLRSLDTFLTAIMEGSIAKGQDAYVRSLLEIVAVFFPVSRALTTYVALSYGDGRTSRAIPFAFGKANRLLAAETTAIAKRLHQEFADQTAREDAAFHTQLQEQLRRELSAYRAMREKIKEGRRECIRKQLSCGNIAWDRYPGPLAVKELVKAFILILAYPSVQQALTPYYTARFAPAWQGQFPSTHLMSWVRDALKAIREENARERDYISEYFATWESRRKKYRMDWEKRVYDKKQTEGAKRSFDIKFQDWVLDRFEQFVERHGEGALVALVLLTTAASYDRFQQSTYVSSSGWCYVPRHEIAKLEVRPDKWSRNNYEGVDYEKYPGYHMLSLPQLVNHQPFTVLWFLHRLNILLAPLNIEAVCRKYYWCGSTQEEKFSWSDVFRPKRHLAFDPYDPAVHQSSFDSNPRYYEKWSSNYKDYILVRNTYIPGRFCQLLAEREDVQMLQKALEGHARMNSLYQLAERHCGGSSWQNWLVIHYLQARAGDLARYGQEIADMTFPQPTLTGATAQEVAESVSWMASILKKMVRQEEQQELAEVKTKLQHRRQVLTTWRPARALAPKMPDSLPARVLNTQEIAAVQKVCVRELSGSAVLTVVHDFVRFCDLLAQPENHIRIPSTQYIETQVNTYTTQEMTNQMAKELMDLPARTAYAKVVNLAPGSESVWKGKIQTLALPRPRAHADDVGTLALEQAIRQGILKKRSVIEAAIRQRQDKWRRGLGTEKPQPPNVNGKPEEPPPPTHF